MEMGDLGNLACLWSAIAIVSCSLLSSLCAISSSGISLRGKDFDPLFPSYPITVDSSTHCCSSSKPDHHPSTCSSSTLPDQHDCHREPYSLQNTHFPLSLTIPHQSLRIGVVHGQQIIPAGDADMLAALARQMDVDVLVSGGTHR
jgi:hypothetical protein